MPAVAEIAVRLRDRPGRIFGVGILARVAAERGSTSAPGGSGPLSRARMPVRRSAAGGATGSVRGADPGAAGPDFERGYAQGKGLTLDEAVSIALTDASTVGACSRRAPTSSAAFFVPRAARRARAIRAEESSRRQGSSRSRTTRSTRPSAPGGRGVDVVTDGEMRRLSFQSQMTEAVEGFGEWDLDAFLWGEWQSEELGEMERRAAAARGRGEAPAQRFLSAEEFAYARGRTDRILKVTLPSPSLFANFWDPERSRGAYASLEEFLGDVAEILREEVDELVRLGATSIQLDAPHYPSSSTRLPGLLRQPRLARRQLARARPRARQPRRTASTTA